MVAAILPVSATSSHPNIERIIMTSTNIYTPYCYLIGWTNHNKWYYGRRTRKGCHPSEFWKNYFTSSKHVEQFRAEHGEPDVIQIRQTFSSAEACARWESSVLLRLKAAQDDKWLNRTNGDGKFHNYGEEASKRQKRIRKDNPDWNTPKGLTNEKRKELGLKLLPGKPKGSKHSEEARKARSERLKGKPTHPNFTSSGHPISEERRRALSENMSKMRTGQAPWNKGKTGVQEAWNKGIPRPRCSCIVCHKEVDNANLIKYHKHEERGN